MTKGGGGGSEIVQDGRRRQAFLLGWLLLLLLLALVSVHCGRITLFKTTTATTPLCSTTSTRRFGLFFSPFLAFSCDSSSPFPSSSLFSLLLVQNFYTFLVHINLDSFSFFFCPLNYHPPNLILHIIHRNNHACNVRICRK
ncbi:hypothetical protein HDK77DRAFT_305059 [Phyllosticta capitalensis]